MKKLYLLSIVAILGLSLNIASAQLKLDRTRVVFDRSLSNSQSVVVSNTSKTDPYLAQSWIEDENGRKIESPLVALPILQRINPNQEKQVKISIAGADHLPTDRESLLYFNVLGVPPKVKGIENQINLVIQTKVKLFYRPKGLKTYPNNGWIKELEVRKNGNSYTLQNPTPYHVVIFATSSGTQGKLTEYDAVIKPFGSSVINRQLGNQPTFHFINDYGGTVTQTYQCSGTQCSLVEPNK